MPRVRFELTTSRLSDSRASYCAIEALNNLEHNNKVIPTVFLETLVSANYTSLPGVEPGVS